MQLRLIFAIAVYLASYLPLSVILLIQDIDYKLVGHPLCLNFQSCRIPIKNMWPAIFGVGICCVGLAVTLVLLAILRPKQKIKLVKAKHVPADLMNYVLPYVVSFMGLSYSDGEKLAGFLVFLIWIFLITYKSGQVIMNPVLTVFGWRLYEIEYSYQAGKDKVHASYCLSQEELEAGEMHASASLQEVFIVKKVPHAHGA